MTERDKHICVKWGIGAFLALLSIFILYLNVLVPYLPGDDHIFLLKLPETGLLGDRPIQSLSDLIESQSNFYNNYHYRVLNHTLLQLLLLCPPIVFDFLNTLVLLILPACILRVQPSTPKDLTYLIKYSFLLAFIWVFHFDLGRCYFLTTGSLNYTWLLVPQLLYITELLRYLEDKGNSSLLILLAVANSMTNENALIALFILTVYVAYVKRNEGPMPIICLVVLLGGLIFMLNSPSIDKRLASEGFRDGGVLSHLIEYFKRVIYYAIRYLPIALLYILLKKARPQFLSQNALTPMLSHKDWLLLGVFFIATASMAFVPLFEPRSAVFGFFILLMTVVSLCDHGVWPVGWMSVGLCIALGVALHRWPAFKNLHERHHHNEVLLQEQRDTQSTSRDTVGLDYYCSRSQYTYLLCHELSTDPNYMDNRTLSNYYNIAAVVSTPLHELEHKRTTLSNLVNNEGLPLGDYNALAINEDTLYYTQSGLIDEAKDSSLGLIMKSRSENFYIVRGARKGSIRGLLLQLLPKDIQLYFLDYMEDTTAKSQAIKGPDGFYNYLEIARPETYRYFLISEYSLVDHTPVGELLRLSLPISTASTSK